ncbi:MAG: hypothetical protein R3A47_08815 [Polyangiales bacterium]
MKTFFLILALSATTWLSTHIARADSNTTPAEVIVVLANESPGKIDPKLKAMPALRRPPFNAFRSMEILSMKKLQLVEEKDETIDLPNGRRLKLTLMKKMQDGRYRAKVSINRPEKHDYLPLLQVLASPGDPFFVAGQEHRGGTLVVGVRVGTDAKPEK